MSIGKRKTVFLVSVLSAQLLCSGLLLGNGGPFVLKYPNGDPAAKGVLARLHPDLKPARETRLRVIKEDLRVSFASPPFAPKNAETIPLAYVSAEYTIENPAENAIEIDFGFPILRGIYTNPRSMAPRPSVHVRLGKEPINATIISNSAIYGLIRQRARLVIGRGFSADPALSKLVLAVSSAQPTTRPQARQALYSHLTNVMKWSPRDAELMLEYASLHFAHLEAAARNTPGMPGAARSNLHPVDRPWHTWPGDAELQNLSMANLGPLAAIGEQKTTQFFAQLASLFDPKAAAGYEAIFAAWGGDVRERSVDLQTGQLRPRELTVEADDLGKSMYDPGYDPTIYARVDYLDPNANITDDEKASCKNVLKNLPVVFTFAPMNILHYRVTFPAKSTQTLTVTYSQYAYSDTRAPASYQLAYVVHPASMWQHFGPINLEVTLPEGVHLHASANAGIRTDVVRKEFKRGGPDIYVGTLKAKSGEIYLAVDAESWKTNGKKKVAQIRKSKAGR